MLVCSGARGSGFKIEQKKTRNAFYTTHPLGARHGCGLMHEVTGSTCIRPNGRASGSGAAVGDYRLARRTTVFAVGPPSQLLYSRVLHLHGIKDLTLKADMDVSKRTTWTSALVLLTKYHVRGTE